MPNYYGFGNGYGNFPAGYPASNPTQQVQPQGAGIVWVQGEASAKAYPVAPGSSVLLMDSEGSRFYIKSADISGMPNPLRTFEFREIGVPALPASPVQTQQTAPDMSAFVTRDELEKRLSALLAPATATNGGTTNESAI